MNAKENAPTREATRAEAAENGFGEARFSCNYSTTGSLERQPLRVSDFLGTGEKNGKTMKQLLEILPGDSRSLRAQIERERRTTPILSGPTGYFLPASEDEVRRFLNSMRHRGRRVMASAANVERSAGFDRRGPQQLDGQEVLF